MHTRPSSLLRGAALCACLTHSGSARSTTVAAPDSPASITLTAGSRLSVRRLAVHVAAFAFSHMSA